MKQLIAPRSLSEIIQIILSVLAILALVRYTMNFGFSDTLEYVIKTYDETLRYYLSPLDVFVDSFLNFLNSIGFSELEIKPQWQHIFILLWVYFISRVGSAFKEGRFLTGGVRFVWGGLIAFIASIVASVSKTSVSELLESFIIASSAVVWILIYELGVNVWYATFFRKQQANLHSRPINTWGKEFFTLSLSDFQRAILATVIILIGINVPVIREQKEPGIIMLAIVVLIYGLFWLFWARQQTKSKNKFLDLKAFWENSDAIVGSSIVKIFIMAILIIAIDSGMQLIFN